MSTVQIIGLIVMALLGFYVFYCIYDLEKFNKKKDHRHKNKVLMLGLLFVALFAGQDALAQVSFDIQASYNSSTKKTTFTITRTGSSLPAQTINFRTVNLSAYAGQHYTAVNGDFTFAANATSTTVEVSEGTPNTDAYKYQNSTQRSYRFEVLDVNGFQLAYYDRNMTTGTQFSNTKVSKSVSDLVTFSGSSFSSGMSSSKYLDVSFTPPSGWVEANDENENENEDFAFISNGEIIVNGEGTVQVIDVTRPCHGQSQP